MTSSDGAEDDDDWTAFEMPDESESFFLKVERAGRRDGIRTVKNRWDAKKVDPVLPDVRLALRFVPLEPNHGNSVLRYWGPSRRSGGPGDRSLRPILLILGQLAAGVIDHMKPQEYEQEPVQG